ncbi:MAG TPA: ATP-binding protein [Actinomycetota bacterium]|nr:ATP-binding protein [Actinomycetota bacterium]
MRACDPEGPRFGNRDPGEGDDPVVVGRDDPLLAASFAADSAAPAEARRVVRGLDVPEGGRDDAVLLTSEVVSNAVKHPGAHPDGRVELWATRSENVLRIEVANRREPWGIGPPVEQPGWDLRRAEALAPSGWGLQLVDQLAARWGTIHESDRTLVWFEVELGPADR